MFCGRNTSPPLPEETRERERGREPNLRVKGFWATRRAPSGSLTTARPGKELRLSEGGSGLGAKRALLKEGVGQIGSKKARFDAQGGGGQAPARGFISDLDVVAFLKKRLSEAVHAVFEDVLRDSSIKVGSYTCPAASFEEQEVTNRSTGNAFQNKHRNLPSNRTCTSDCACTFLTSNTVCSVVLCIPRRSSTKSPWPKSDILTA
jgi:hypothetical protein